MRGNGAKRLEEVDSDAEEDCAFETPAEGIAGTHIVAVGRGGQGHQKEQVQGYHGLVENAESVLGLVEVRFVRGSCHLHGQRHVEEGDDLEDVVVSEVYQNKQSEAPSAQKDHVPVHTHKVFQREPDDQGFYGL